VSERLRFATLNVWALPAGIARHVAPRMEAIARRLGELELDVAALQEVWTPSARSALVAGGRRAGLAHAWHRREAFGGSGLLLLSRRPLGDPLFSPYTLRGLPQRIHHGDYWSGKGFVIATLETAAGPLALLDTHLHARYTRPVDEYRGIRTGQVIELAAGLLDRPEPLLALGDFNLRTGHPDHAVLMGLTGFRDVALTLGNPQDTVLSRNPYRGAGHRGDERIDYAFVRTGRRAELIPVSITRDFASVFEIDGVPASYSDHAGLVVELEITPTPPRVLPTAAPEALARARALLDEGRAEAKRRRGVERSFALGTGALAVAALPTASHLRATRRRFLAGLAAGFGVACVPAAGLLATLSEIAIPREFSAYDRVEALLDRFIPAS